MGRFQPCRTINLYAVSDGLGRPIPSLPVSIQATGYGSAEALLEGLVPRTPEMADRG